MVCRFFILYSSMPLDALVCVAQTRLRLCQIFINMILLSVFLLFISLCPPTKLTVGLLINYSSLSYYLTSINILTLLSNIQNCLIKSLSAFVCIFTNKTFYIPNILAAFKIPAILIPSVISSFITICTASRRCTFFNTISSVSSSSFSPGVKSSAI